MKNKPKGRTPSLLNLSNGKPERVQVRAKSECSRCGCAIEIGHDCFGIPRIVAGFSNLKRYCKTCYQAIIEQTEKDLNEAKKI